jgi:hypothetical protein
MKSGHVERARMREVSSSINFWELCGTNLGLSSVLAFGVSCGLKS